MYKLSDDIKKLKTWQLFPNLVVKLGNMFQDYLGYNFPDKKSYMKITLESIKTGIAF